MIVGNGHQVAGKKFGRRSWHMAAKLSAAGGPLPGGIQ
jgi:hypothetical protein